jgi:hypothetical protein
VSGRELGKVSAKENGERRFLPRSGVDSYNPSTQEAQAGLSGVQGQPEPCSKILAQKEERGVGL